LAPKRKGCGMNANANPLRVFKVEFICGKGNGAIVDPKKTSPVIEVTAVDVGLTSHSARARVEGELYRGGAHWVKVLSVKRDVETEVLSEQLLKEMLSYLSSPF
jgi:hypothetical protein